MDVIAAAVGAVLLTLLLTDVFATVFIERGGPGPVSGLLYTMLWRCWCRLCRLTRGHRRRLLAVGGPLLLPLTVLLWAVELVLGFALLYLPEAEGFFSPDPSGSAPFVTALYVSGYSASTLGVGDVYPQTVALRLLTTTEAALGFAVFSVSIAYLLSVYGALRQSKALALEISRFLDLDHQPDGLQVLCSAIQHGREDELAYGLHAISTRLVQVSEAQQQYPLVEYFHVPDDVRALPLALQPLLELLTMCRTWLDPERHPALAAGPGSAFSLRTGSAYVTDRARRLRTPHSTSCGSADPAGRAGVGADLLAAGAVLRPVDEVDGEYGQLHRAWAGPLHVLQRHYGYE